MYQTSSKSDERCENKAKILFRSESMLFSTVIFTKLVFVHQHYADLIY